MRVTKLTSLACAALSLLVSTELFAVSESVRAQNDYIFTLGVLREIRVIVDNFGDQEHKNQYEAVKAQFNTASEEFYAQNFSSSCQKYHNVKERLIVLMESIADNYIKRTQAILDSTSKSSFDIIIKYGNKGGLKQYFTRAYNPVEDIKPYKEEEYHFFHDKETIERYLRNGYKKLEEAKRIFNDSDLAILKKKKRKTPANLDYIIGRYTIAVSRCRLGKQYGIEIHKLIKSHLIGDILKKYNLTDQALDPIFDDRIPEEYKVDANDNLTLVHSIEKERLDNRTQQKK